MDPKLSAFLNGLEVACALAAIDYTIKNLHNAGLDLGFGDLVIKRTILTVLGKLQATLIKASNDASRNGFVMTEHA